MVRSLGIAPYGRPLDLEVGDLVFCSSAGPQWQTWSVYGGSSASHDLEPSQRRIASIVKEMRTVPVVQLRVDPDGPLYLVGTIEGQGTSILAYASSGVMAEAAPQGGGEESSEDSVVLLSPGVMAEAALQGGGEGSTPLGQLTQLPSRTNREAMRPSAIGAK